MAFYNISLPLLTSLTQKDLIFDNTVSSQKTMWFESECRNSNTSDWIFRIARKIRRPWCGGHPTNPALCLTKFVYVMTDWANLMVFVES